MKICFPVKNNLGMEIVPYGHFGTAPMFVVCDLEKGEVRTISNGAVYITALLLIVLVKKLNAFYARL